LDFEIVDALGKLERMQLVELTTDLYHAVTLQKAKKILGSHWENSFNYA